MPSLRERVTAASLPVVETLNRLPRPVPFLAVLGLMVAGIFVPGWGWVFLLVVVLFLAWTLFLAWPALDTGARAGRVAVLLIAVAITLTQALPRT
ncbi:hypothetical protein SAMN04489867_1448 [Pedococcus dokdonensis]|uniref:Uncharacterized protein n=1 Tax=Pedococcus dokdonensis TaxID=443156 RepID=A0A1H0Q1D8_9MICO|nr:DUF6703 family protein [Pedococcus dokdonensis]SDP11183.1 hypothetical protein SAMN04489867_1448 [Pedococcus dokdonensis]